MSTATSCIRTCRIIRRHVEVALAISLLALSALAASTSLAADVPTTKILYINSYHRGYSWSDGLEDGLREALEASGRKFEISVEYLDSRRFAYNSLVEPLAKSMEVKYASYRPDLVVVSDNAAFDFALQFRDRLFPGKPIVFCGYNDFRPEVLDGIQDVTGVNEEIDVTGAVEMAIKVHPKTRALAFIVSTGEASSSRIGEMAERDVFPKLRDRFEVVVMKDLSITELSERLAKLPPETLLFLCGQVRDVGAGRALSPSENGRLITSVSPFPTYTFWDFHLNQGVIGGHIITGPDQGRAAADLALRVLSGTPAGQIPVIMTTPHANVFDYEVLEKFGVSESRLPPNARVINRPHSLWTQYRIQIIGVVVLMTLETILIAVLLRMMRERRLALQELSKERELLEHRVEERTSELKIANDQLAELSLKDALTGLANRRRLDEALEVEFRRLHRSGKPLSLIMLDVDHFKNFNDAHGHVAGDECLRRIGTLIGGMVCRSPDLAARYGGEEFAIILPETGSQGAAGMAERIRKAVEDLRIEHADSPVAGWVTVSLGVTTVFPSRMDSALEVVTRADGELYNAKSAGRNRVSTLYCETTN
ncbi:diguanylate cyclase [Fundidesulfovibrio agrisoli]|uniref:diguanylate cyclase n=1 Tax=Fundidesulfovibrio agrisoli TaxID=2922717 RepID=UPI001FAE333E|nr:diguanylate cyclase [Fundidesulfovibrio agrisoli]